MPRKVRRRRRGTRWLSGKAMVMVAILLPVVFLGTIHYNSEPARQERAARARVRLAEIAQQEAALKTQANQQSEQALIAIANQRYRAACVMPWVRKSDEQGYYYEVLALGAGQVVIDYQTGKPIGDKQIVCDDRGMSYEIEGGVTANPARTDDPELINQRFEDSAKWHPRARRSTVIAPETITQK